MDRWWVTSPKFSSKWATFPCVEPFWGVLDGDAHAESNKLEIKLGSRETRLSDASVER